MKSRTIGASALLFLAAGTSGCSAADESASVEGKPGVVADPFSTAPREPNHEQITATALSFLRPELLSALQAADAATDAEFFFVNANHFDDCNFTGGSAVVQQSQAEAVSALEPGAPPESDARAIRAFGRSLHAVQDFYSHTNWIELGGDVLVDSTFGAFPTLGPYSTIPSSGFVVVQGAKAKRATVTRKDDAPYPENAVVTVKLDKRRKPGLISGTVEYEAGNYCPPSVAMTHDELNKDTSTTAGRARQYEAAKALAILQTEHEWCRLRELTRAQWGDAGVDRLDTWVAAGATPPACR